jgi:glycosyltransferase involved in cell wall biosynthesis
MAVLEAAACGAATVGTAVGILPELARDGAARTVAVHDPVALSAALWEVLEDRGRARTLGATARQRIATESTLDLAVERLEAVYSGAAQPDGTR